MTYLLGVLVGAAYWSFVYYVLTPVYGFLAGGLPFPLIYSAFVLALIWALVILAVVYVRGADNMEEQVDAGGAILLLLLAIAIPILVNFVTWLGIPGADRLLQPYRFYIGAASILLLVLCYAFDWWGDFQYNRKVRRKMQTSSPGLL